MYINFETKEYFLKKHPDGPIICTTFKLGFSLPGREATEFTFGGIVHPRTGGVELFTLAWTGGAYNSFHTLSGGLLFCNACF